MAHSYLDVRLQNVKDGDEADLVLFFGDIGEINLQKTTFPAKGVEEIVRIVLEIAGAWGLERFVLDPLADRLQAWLKATSSLDGKQFKIRVVFKDAIPKSFETAQISNPLILREIWKLLKEASDLLKTSPQKDLIDRIMIIPHRQKKVLVIGYQGKHPSYLLDLDDKTIMPLRSGTDSDRSLKMIFRQIEQSAAQLERLRIQTGPDDARIKALEDRIEQILAACVQTI